MASRSRTRTPLSFASRREGLRECKVFDELIFGVPEEKVVVCECLARDDAEEVDEALCSSVDEGADVVEAGASVKDGDVDVGVGVGRVEYAAAGDEARGIPQLEDAVDLEEMGEDRGMQVEVLACIN